MHTRRAHDRSSTNVNCCILNTCLLYTADQLYVAERTVKTHTYHIYQKMGIHSQQELIDIVEAQEAGEKA